MRLKGVFQMLLEELPLVFKVLDLDLVEEVRHLQPQAAALSLQELRRAHPQV